MSMFGMASLGFGAMGTNWDAETDTPMGVDV